MSALHPRDLSHIGLQEHQALAHLLGRFIVPPHYDYEVSYFLPNHTLRSSHEKEYARPPIS